MQFYSIIISIIYNNMLLVFLLLLSSFICFEKSI